jgi:ABC-type transporter lipoprotein component MlaA
MSDKIKSGQQAVIDDIASFINRAYYDPVYRISKAALEPVVAAFSDVIRESVAEAVKDGIRDAITSTDFITELFFRRKSKR